MNLEKETYFIAKHYKEGMFAVVPALRRIKTTGRSWWTFPKIAAASIILIVFGATAAVLIKTSYISNKGDTIPEPPAINTPIVPVSKAIDFDDTPLPIVIQQIESVYGVEIVDMPLNAEDYHLSLHYEGTAGELIENINEILGIHLKVQE